MLINDKNAFIKTSRSSILSFQIDDLIIPLNFFGDNTYNEISYKYSHIPSLPLPSPNQRIIPNENRNPCTEFKTLGKSSIASTYIFWLLYALRQWNWSN